MAESWEKAKTLDQVVVRAILEKRTKTPEFEHILRFYGREKVLRIWNRYLEEKKNAQAKDKS